VYMLHVMFAFASIITASIARSASCAVFRFVRGDLRFFATQGRHTLR